MDGAFAFSPEELQRMERVDRLAAAGAGAIATLVDMLDDPSWTVRRAVVAALATGGDASAGPLCEALGSRRDNEARIAATVDALATMAGDPDGALAAMADDPRPAVVADVAQILGRRRTVTGLPTLIALTRHADDNVAVAAIEALGRVGGRAAVDSLVDAVGSGHFFRTFPAIDVLGRSGDPRAVAPLTGLLDRPHYASEAARALGRTGDKAAVRPLCQLLDRSADAIVRVAALALKDLQQRNAERYGSPEGIEEEIRREGGAGATRRLVRALSGGDPNEQAAICFVLGALRDVSAAPALTALLDGPPEVVEATSSALKRLGPAAEAQIVRGIREGAPGTRRALLPLVSRMTASGEVVACLADADPDVRALACEALARMGATSASGALFGLLADPNPRVAFAAQAAVQSLGSRDTETLALAAARAPEPRVRRAAIRVLSYFGYPSALDVLLEGLQDPDERVSEASIQGLPFFEDPRAFDALLAAAKAPVARKRGAAMRALGQCGGEPRATAFLIKGMSDGDSWVRYYACQALGKLAFEPAAEAIARLLDDPAGQVRVAAVEALSCLESEVARRALAAAVTDAESDVRRAALAGLGVAHRAESLPVILAAATSKDLATRLVALSAVVSFRSPDVVRVLADAAADPDENVRTVAIGLLAAMPGANATAALAALLRRAPTHEQVVGALALPIEGRVADLSAELEQADDEIAVALTSALARMRRPDAMTALLGAMTCPNSRARKAAATTLAGLGTKEGLAVLRVAASQDPELEVRRICALLIAR